MISFNKLKRNILFQLSSWTDRFIYSIKVQKGVRISNSTILEGNNRIGERTQIIGSHIGAFSYIGKDSKLNNVIIGRFCSLGSNIRSGLGIHPTSNFISTHPIFFSINEVVGQVWVDYQKFKEHKYVKENYFIEIKNDVWIGDNVMIMDGVTIGNGAIIAAGSVVTKDVKDFQIVGGIPAKQLKYRFDEDDRSFLLRSKWWEFEIDHIRDISNSFENIETFRERINES